MSYQALARKWRPKTFSELVGQEHVVTALTNALKTQRLHHAYLFTGTRGVGKTTLARILAKALNCETGITPTPCGVCGACTAIDRGGFVDLLEVDAATNTRVEEMRELLDNTQYMPTSGRFKVYIIDEVHMLSRSAFNSMLKTLEEPPEHVKFILATTDPQKVPVTVLSRCLQFNLKQMPLEAISAHLGRVLAAENITSEPPALDAVARAAQGSMRDALSLLDQAIAFGEGKVTTATVSSMLGAIDQEYLFNLLDRIADRDGKAMFDEARRMAERSLSLETALQDMATILHQVALRQLMPDAPATEGLEGARINTLAGRLSAEDVQLYYQIALVGRRDMPLAPDEFAGFTMALMRMLAFAADVPSGTTLVTAKAVTPHQPIRESRGAGVSGDRRPAGERAAIEKAAPAAPSPATEGAVRFDGDWLGLAASLKLTGMAGMLARHCELKSVAQNRIELAVPDEHKHLAEKIYIDKLRMALSAHFGVGVQLQVRVSTTTGNTLAEAEERQQRTKQSEAVAAIEQDVFVRDLVENLDARLIDASIRPIQ